MDGNDEQFENYLREFEPRKPRALEPKRQSAPDSWRRLAAAAAMMIALGTSLRLVLHLPGRQGLQTVATAKPVRVRFSIVPLTKHSGTSPLSPGAELAAGSKPAFAGL